MNSQQAIKPTIISFILFLLFLSNQSVLEGNTATLFFYVISSVVPYMEYMKIPVENSHLIM